MHAADCEFHRYFPTEGEAKGGHFPDPAASELGGVHGWRREEFPLVLRGNNEQLQKKNFEARRYDSR